jgi:DNA polymerase III alpha subunit
LASVDALMRRASELEMPALALTDHANLSGLVAMIEAGRRYGVKPIIGCDLPVAPFTAAPDLPGRGGRGQEPLTGACATSSP